MNFFIKQRTQLVLISIFFLGVGTGGPLTSARAAAPSTSSQSIQDLLNQAEGALMAKPTAEPKTTPKKRVKKAPAPAAESEPVTASQPSSGHSLTPAPAATNTSDSKLTPFDGAGVDKVLALDLQAQQREHESFYPQSVVFLGLGSQRLTGNYSLTKDDDTFVNSGKSNLTGVYLEVSPRLKVDWLSGAVATTFASLSFASGYFQGDVAVNRSGVQTGVETYKYQLFPGDASLQLGVELWSRVGIYGSYGAGVEVLHQSGRGTTDSVTDAFYGEVASIGVFGNLSRTVQLFVNYKARGTRLILKQNTISGQMIMGGVAFALTG